MDALEDIPDRDDRCWIHPFKYAMDTVVKLKLYSGEVKKPKKKEQNEYSVKETEQEGKRPRGRPRKNPAEEKSKRSRGHPMKNPI